MKEIRSNYQSTDLHTDWDDIDGESSVIYYNSFSGIENNGIR
jgi:hypothetical protein